MDNERGQRVPTFRESFTVVKHNRWFIRVQAGKMVLLSDYITTTD